MLTFYYHPLSPIARRVWIALLEKELPFEARLVNLTGEQFRSEFLALNPFHHVPVLVDGEVRVVESLAILDYLEAKYPTPSLLVESPEAIARMRMVQMVTINELTPKLPALALASENPDPDEATLQHVFTVFDFLTEQLGDGPFFGGESLSLDDITAGATLPLIQRLGVSLERHPAIAAWHNRLMARDAWQQTEPNEADFSIWKRWILLKIKRHQQKLARA